MSFTKTTPGWEIGKWLVICDRCGFKKTNDQVAKEPSTNLIVCKDTCWEPRHPQEFVRPRPDPQGVPFTRPECTDVFIDTPVIDAQYLDLPGTAGNYASTPDSAAVSITGDIDIRVKVALDDWTPGGSGQRLITKRPSATLIAYDWSMPSDGTLQLFWSADGSTQLNAQSTAAVGATDGAVKWVRVTLDVDNGAAGRDIKFYTSDDGIAWVQLGATLTQAGVTSIFDNAGQVWLGDLEQVARPFNGKIYYAELRNGIGGEVAAKFDPANDASVGDTSFTSSTGEVWTINQSGDPEAELTRTVLPPNTIPSGTFDNSLDE
jgi:hypothetical protein